MKKKYMIIFAVILVLITGVCYFNYAQKQKEQEEKKELEYLYKQQNQAFAVDCYLADMSFYHGSDELNVSKLAMSLYVYSMDKPTENIDVQEVIDYFGEEYDDNGTLKVYMRPDSFNEYIEWWWHGGSKKIDDFSLYFVDYMRTNGGDYKIENYSLEELQDLFPLVWTYANK
ncbi:hypothetical protein [Butyrivibrio proteoclasticus]|uniref:hypothetical protein n=1 Tax=Butyrivibrio proteoclasticus TaxID=43305 RepID=UPI00047A74A4|nr:hypothetical protein [Butyrivibrio proteoclasticus]